MHRLPIFKFLALSAKVMPIETNNTRYSDKQIIICDLMTRNCTRNMCIKLHQLKEIDALVEENRYIFLQHILRAHQSACLSVTTVQQLISYGNNLFTVAGKATDFFKLCYQTDPYYYLGFWSTFWHIWRNLQHSTLNTMATVHTPRVWEHW